MRVRNSATGARKLLALAQRMMGQGSDCAVTFPFPLIVMCLRKNHRCSSYGIIKGSIVGCQLGASLYAS